mmetsp:Transcript_8868/g.32688  ORF Transcript_8868/g.32688 Transcript_8868/m.32688 type:complete len:112 (-) Transcript_8868:1658-1993(-)
MVRSHAHELSFSRLRASPKPTDTMGKATSRDPIVQQAEHQGEREETRGQAWHALAFGNRTSLHFFDKGNPTFGTLCEVHATASIGGRLGSSAALRRVAWPSVSSLDTHTRL